MKTSTSLTPIHPSPLFRAAVRLLSIALTVFNLEGALAQSPDGAFYQPFDYQFKYVSGANPDSSGFGDLYLRSEFNEVDGGLKSTRVIGFSMEFDNLDALPDRVFGLGDIISFSPAYDPFANNIGFPQIFGRNFSITGLGDFGAAGPDEKYLATVDFGNGTTVYEATVLFPPAVPEHVSMLGAGIGAASVIFIRRRLRR